jgi:hypothetical protein
MKFFAVIICLYCESFTSKHLNRIIRNDTISVLLSGCKKFANYSKKTERILVNMNPRGGNRNKQRSHLIMIVKI